ncbi:hypothetical protein BGZ98_008406 [Dissophora globulifera]|nr:hypothetical protein BGZ98_008406 [Dissophora globulifera]
MRWRLIRLPVQPFFTGTNEFMSKFLMDDQIALDSKDECVGRRTEAYRMIKDVQDWISRVVSKDPELWYPVVMGLVDVLKLDTKPERYFQYMMGHYPSELKLKGFEDDKLEIVESDGEGEDSQKSFTAPEAVHQLEWTNELYDKDQVFVRINLRRLEKGIAVFHHLVGFLPVDAKTEMGLSRIQELVDKTTLLREQVRAVLTCDGVHHVTPSEIESMQCPEPEPEVDTKDILGDDVWLDLHIGYEVSSWFSKLLDALIFNMPMEWEMKMVADLDVPARCGHRLVRKAKLAKEKRRQQMAEGFSLSSPSLSPSICSLFPPAREPFKWTRFSISSLAFGLWSASEACYYGAPLKRAAILF